MTRASLENQSSTEVQEIPTSSGAAEKEKRRRMVVFGSLGVVFVIGLACYVFWGKMTKAQHVNVPPVNGKRSGETDGKNISGGEMTTEAIASIKKQLEGSAPSAGNTSPADAKSPVTSPAGSTLPVTATGSTTFQGNDQNQTSKISSPGSPNSSQPNSFGAPYRGAEAAHDDKRTYAGYRAISYADKTPLAPAPLVKSSSDESPSRSERVSLPSSFPRSPQAISASRPSLGTLLPVTLLGGLSTLVQNGLVRFQLSRDAAGRNWRLPQGTVFVGRVAGSDLNRGYVRILGYLTETDEFVPLSASLTANDGLPGLVGERRRLDSRWASILGRLGNAGLVLGQSVLLSRSRGGVFAPVGSLPEQIAAPELATLQNTARKNEFVQVLAGTTGYLLVDELPEIRTVQVLRPVSSTDTSSISEAELMELMQDFNADRIRDALPRMTPEIRGLFERALQLDAEGRRLQNGK